MCNARVSDRVGNSPLLRINEVHHTIALFPSDYPGVQHINHQTESFDDIMRSWYFLKEKGVRIVFGPGRHPTSGAIFLYFDGPDGMVYEYSTGVKIISPGRGEDYQPRQFPFEPAGLCMWGSKPDIREFSETRDRGVACEGRMSAAREQSRARAEGHVATSRLHGEARQINTSGRGRWSSWRPRPDSRLTPSPRECGERVG